MCKTAKKLKEGSIDGQRYRERLYNSTWHFLHLCMNGNHNILEKIEDVEYFINEIFTIEYNQWKLYINYDYLKDYLLNCKKQYSKSELVALCIQLYSMFHFVENILLIMEDGDKNRITERKKVHGLIGLGNFLCEIVFGGRKLLRTDLKMVEFTAHYRNVLNHALSLLENDFDKKKTNWEYFYNLVDIRDGEIITNLEQAFTKDRDWLQSISGALSLVYGGLYLIKNSDLHECKIYKKRDKVFHYQYVIEEIMESFIVSEMNHFDLITKAKKEIKSVKRSIKSVKSSDKFEETVQGYRKILENNYAVEDEKSSEIYMLPITYIIQKINQILEKDDFISVIALLPDSDIQDIKSHLKRDINKKEIFSVRQRLIDSVMQWDNNCDGIYLSDVLEVFDWERQSVDINYKKQIQNLVTYLQSFALIGEDIDIDEAWYIVEERANVELRQRLSSINYALHYKSDIKEEDRTETEILVRNIENKLDLAVSMMDLTKFEDAVRVAIKLHVIIRLNVYYLYSVLVEREESGQANYYSRTLFFADRERTEETLYYKLFKEMKGRMEKYKNKKKKDQMIGKYIEVSAQQERTVYILRLFEE